MIRRMDPCSPAAAKRILALQAASYRVEAELISFEEIPPLMDTPETLRACGETFYGCFQRGELMGLIAYRLEEGAVDICRLAVHPDHFRKGVAERLLAAVERRHPHRARMLVSTGRGNLPAVRFYLKHGFHPVRDEEVAPGLFITRFEKP